MRLDHMRLTAIRQRLFVTLTGVALVLPAAFSLAATPAGKFKNTDQAVRALALEEMADSGDLV